jgi:hypothetical protein
MRNGAIGSISGAINSFLLSKHVAGNLVSGLPFTPDASIMRGHLATVRLYLF